MPSLFKQKIRELQSVSSNEFQSSDKSKSDLAPRLRDKNGRRYPYFYGGQFCILKWNWCLNCLSPPHYHIQKLGAKTCRQFNPRYFELEISFESEILQKWDS